jgi:hypothetical protein
MLPGARAGSSGDRTRLDRTSCPGPSMMMPNGFARWRIPGETGSQRAASRRGLARTGASRTQSGNDVRTTSPRLRGELRLTLDTLSHIRLCSSHLWRSIHCAGACNFFLDAEGLAGRTCTGWIAPALPGAPIRGPRRRARGVWVGPRCQAVSWSVG